MKVANLNSGSFAGHTDWRVPNSKELYSILNLENANPSVSPAFNTGCAPACTVLTCSCTVSNYSWSSSPYSNYPDFAWLVFFSDGYAAADLMARDFHYVRAVRGGS